MAKRKYFPLVTGRVVAAYPHVEERDTEGDFPTDKFTITTYLEPGSEELAAVEALVKAAFDHEWPNGVPKGAFSALKLVEADPDKPDKLNVGKYRLLLKSDERPDISGPDGKPLPEGVHIKGGDIVRIAGAVAAWERKGKCGVTCYLNAVRLIEKRQIDHFGGAEEGAQEEEAAGDVGKQNFNF